MRVTIPCVHNPVQFSTAHIYEIMHFQSWISIVYSEYRPVSMYCFRVLFPQLRRSPRSTVVSMLRTSTMKACVVAREACRWMAINRENKLRDV